MVVRAIVAGDYMAEYCRVVTGDTRSLDYSSYTVGFKQGPMCGFEVAAHGNLANFVAVFGPDMTCSTK